MYNRVKKFGGEPVTRLPHCGIGILDEAAMERKRFLKQVLGNTDIPDGVLKMFGEPSDSELMDLARKTGSPWDRCYAEGKRSVIPDNITKAYFERIIE